MGGRKGRILDSYLPRLLAGTRLSGLPFPILTKGGRGGTTVAARARPRDEREGPASQRLQCGDDSRRGLEAPEGAAVGKGTAEGGRSCWAFLPGLSRPWVFFPPRTGSFSRPARGPVCPAGGGSFSSPSSRDPEQALVLWPVSSAPSSLPSGAPPPPPPPHLRCGPGSPRFACRGQPDLGEGRTVHPLCAHLGGRCEEDTEVVLRCFLFFDGCEFYSQPRREGGQPGREGGCPLSTLGGVLCTGSLLRQACVTAPRGP